MEARSSLFLSSKISVVYSFALSFFLSSPKFSSEFSCFETPRKGFLCMLYMFYHPSFSLIHLLMHQIPFIHFEFMLSKRAATARSKYTRKKCLQISHNPCFFHARWFESYWSIPLWKWSFFRLLYSILSQIPCRVFGTTTGSFIVSFCFFCQMII